jgi:hypothetical protein
LVGLLLASAVQAQWLTQQVPLSPGWNAVFLRVQPEPATCREVFASLPVTAVYQWNGEDHTLQFTASPNQLLPRDDDWLFWLPPSHPQAPVSTLHAVHANQSYLIRVAADAPPLTWQIKGRPQLFRPAWRSAALNLRGLPVPKDTATFAGFFQACPAIPLTRTEGGEIQEVTLAGDGSLIWTPSRTKVMPGRAYWIRSRKSTDFTGPLEVRLDFGTALTFTPGKSERYLTLRNQTSAALPVTVRLRPSEPSPPRDEYATPAGMAPLSRVEKDWTDGRPKTVYRVFEAPLTRTLAAGEFWTLKLVLREREMVDDPPDSVRLGLLEITGGEHFLDTVGVIARR